MTYDEIKKDLAPCGLSCATCMVYAEGEIKHHAEGLARLLGDFDSADPALVARAEAEGVAIERVAAEKDESDLELAVRAAVARGATSMVIVNPDERLTTPWSPASMCRRSLYGLAEVGTPPRRVRTSRVAWKT